MFYANVAMSCEQKQGAALQRSCFFFGFLFLFNDYINKKKYQACTLAIRYCKRVHRPNARCYSADCQVLPFWSSQYLKGPQDRTCQPCTEQPAADFSNPIRLNFLVTARRMTSHWPELHANVLLFLFFFYLWLYLFLQHMVFLSVCIMTVEPEDLHWS